MNPAVVHGEKYANAVEAPQLQRLSIPAVRSNS